MSGGYYESERGLGEYLLFHYGAAEEILPYAFGPKEALHFPVRCVSQCLDTSALVPNARALDIGCAVGRATFELARWCGEVVGIDFSERFIRTASHLKTEGVVDFEYAVEGELTALGRAVVPPEIDRGRVNFEQGDAMALRRDLGSFDVILMANLIDRLREPGRCLERLSALLNPGGQLILISPYTWLPEYTPREHWLGGYWENGRPVRTAERLERLLRPTFEFVARKDLPFLIREHARKFQWSVAEGSIWKRRS